MLVITIFLKFGTTSLTLPSVLYLLPDLRVLFFSQAVYWLSKEDIRAMNHENSKSNFYVKIKIVEPKACQRALQDILKMTSKGFLKEINIMSFSASL